MEASSQSAFLIKQSNKLNWNRREVCPAWWDRRLINSFAWCRPFTECSALAALCEPLSSGAASMSARGMCHMGKLQFFPSAVVDKRDFLLNNALLHWNTTLLTVDSVQCKIVWISGHAAALTCVKLAGQLWLVLVASAWVFLYQTDAPRSVALMDIVFVWI